MNREFFGVVVPNNLLQLFHFIRFVFRFYLHILGIPNDFFTIDKNGKVTQQNGLSKWARVAWENSKQVVLCVRRLLLEQAL